MFTTLAAAFLTTGLKVSVGFDSAGRGEGSTWSLGDSALNPKVSTVADSARMALCEDKGAMDNFMEVRICDCFSGGDFGIRWGAGCGAEGGGGVGIGRASQGRL